VARQEDSKESRLLLSDEIHLLLYCCVLQVPARRHTHRDYNYAHQRVIAYGNSSRAWYPFPLLRLTEISIKKKSYLNAFKDDMC
jgi:hypothetical protein